MKKFSTYNGLFTHNPTVFPQSITHKNNEQTNFSAYQSTNTNARENTEETEVQGQILHYPQSEQDYPFIQAKPNIPNNEQSKNDKVPEDSNKTEDLPDYSDYKLSHNAKFILECMRLHDKIIGQHEKSSK